MKLLEQLSDITNQDLVARMEHAVRVEQRAVAHVVALLSEMHRRGIYRDLGYSSLFTYCTKKLGYSEDATYTRIEVAKKVRKFPLLLEQLEAGRISLTVARMLAPNLTAENHKRLIDEALGKTKREAELIVATMRPLPPVPSVVRKLLAPAMRSAEPPAPPSSVPPPPQPASRRPVVAPLSEAHYRIQVTFTREDHEVLKRAQGLLRHQIPNGDPARVLRRALDELVKSLEKSKFALVAHPREPRDGADPTSRQVPAHVRRAVRERDGERCAFAGSDGQCTETEGLEFHHVIPFAAGGGTTVDNLELRCRAHNQLEGEQFVESLLSAR